MTAQRTTSSDSTKEEVVTDVLLQDAVRAVSALQRIVQLTESKYDPENPRALLTAIQDIAKKALAGG